MFVRVRSRTQPRGTGNIPLGVYCRFHVAAAYIATAPRLAGERLLGYRKCFHSYC